MILLHRAVLGMLLLTACGASTSEATHVSGDTPCNQIIRVALPGHLENVVLRGGETDGLIFALDGWTPLGSSG